MPTFYKTDHMKRILALIDVRPFPSDMLRSHKQWLNPWHTDINRITLTGLACLHHQLPYPFLIGNRVGRVLPHATMARWAHQPQISSIKRCIWKLVDGTAPKFILLEKLHALIGSLLWNMYVCMHVCLFVCMFVCLYVCMIVCLCHLHPGIYTNSVVCQSNLCNFQLWIHKMSKIHWVSFMLLCRRHVADGFLNNWQWWPAWHAGDGPPAPRSSMVPLFGLQELCSRHRGLRRRGNKPATMELDDMYPIHAGHIGVNGEMNEDWTKNDGNVLKYIDPNQPSSDQTVVWLATCCLSMTSLLHRGKNTTFFTPLKSSQGWVFLS